MWLLQLPPISHSLNTQSRRKHTCIRTNRCTYRYLLQEQITRTHPLIKKMMKQCWNITISTVYVSMCMYVCMCVCMCVYMYVYTYASLAKEALVSIIQAGAFNWAWIRLTGRDIELTTGPGHSCRTDTDVLWNLYTCRVLDEKYYKAKDEIPYTWNFLTLLFIWCVRTIKLKTSTILCVCTCLIFNNRI